MLAWLGAFPGPVTVGMEATRYWEWLATRLAKAEDTVRELEVPIAALFTRDEGRRIFA